MIAAADSLGILRQRLRAVLAGRLDRELLLNARRLLVWRHGLVSDIIDFLRAADAIVHRRRSRERVDGANQRLVGFTGLFCRRRSRTALVVCPPNWCPSLWFRGRSHHE